MWWTKIIAWAGSNTRLIAYGIAIAAVCTVLGIGWHIAKDKGRTEEKVKTLTKITNDVRKVHAIQDNNRATLHSGDAAKLLGAKWARD